MPSSEACVAKVTNVSKNTGNSSRVGVVKERAQAKNPVTDRYVKIDTSTGRILDQKKTPGPYKRIKDLTNYPSSLRSK